MQFYGLIHNNVFRVEYALIRISIQPDQFLKEHQIPHQKLSDQVFYEKLAKLLADEKVLGWFQGRMEFGPRALGSRSILGDSRSSEMQKKMNLKIKFRESFRPFAPTVLEDKASAYFEIDRPSPYMLLVAKVNEDRRFPQPSPDGLGLLERLKNKRSNIPAVTHLDYSARIQTVNKNDKPDYYGVISEFEKLTGCSVVVNTSFNVRGEPIVCSPEHAYRCFMATDMDALVMENFLLLKKEQPDAQEHDLDSYLAQFTLD